MSSFFDLFGFLSVVANGLDLIAQCVMIGTIAFLLFAAAPLEQQTGPTVTPAAFGILRTSAALAAVAATAVIALGAAALMSTLGTRLEEVASADFMIAGLVKIAAAALVFAIAARRRSATSLIRVALGALALCALCALLATSHAAARPGDRTVMLAATALHASGAALWLGGLPCFWAALRRECDPRQRQRIGARYSSIAIAGVGLIVAGAAAMTYDYIGSTHALYGTAYGAMAIGKMWLLAVLLLLGLGNYLAVKRLGCSAGAATRIQRFVEIEMGVGAAAIMLAASITSVPPAIDTPERITLAELAERMAPRQPRLASPDRASLAIPALQAKADEQPSAASPSPQLDAPVPGAGGAPPRNAQDIAWSEYNHHWAGIVVLAVGLAALLNRAWTVPLTRHWPLLFLLLAGLLFYRADPEVWPAGSIGFLQGLRDPEVAQHRLFVLLTIAFAFFEWGVRTGRIASWRLALVFPLLTALGGTLLLTHSHAIANPREELLIEYTHLPMAILGILAGWARWLELRGDPGQRRSAGWVWPACFVLIGLLLIDYREA